MRLEINHKIARLNGMSTTELITEYERLSGGFLVSPRRHRLIRKLIWLYQCEDFAPISAAALERAKSIAQISSLRTHPPQGFNDQIPSTEKEFRLNPGSILVRTFRGKRIEVTVRERGFEWNGKLYKTISGVAKAITGTQWNGKRFFNLI